jgi:cytochrome c-type biogenesis protein CcmH/NrfG
MKKIFTIIIIALFTLPAWSQDEEVAKMDPRAQEKIRAARIAYITDRLGLTPEEAERFWPIYREFSNKRMELKQQFDQARKNPNTSKPKEEVERELVDLGLKLKQQELDLEKDYSKRILDVIPAQKLMALKKAEDDFRRLLIQQIQQRQLQQQRKQQLQERNEQRLRQRNN